jgi:hypothetical protein
MLVSSFVLYSLALLGLITALAFAVLLVLVLVERLNRTSNTEVRAAHRRARN